VKRKLNIKSGAIRLSAVLLMLVLTVVLGLAFSIFAEETKTVALTVTTTDDTKIAAYELAWTYQKETGVIKGDEATPDALGTGLVFDGIPYNAEIRLYITTTPGWALKEETPGQFPRDKELGVQYFYKQGLIEENFSLVLDFAEAQYSVTLLDSDKSADYDYKLIAPEGFTVPATHVFGGTLELPDIDMEGRGTFNGRWHLAASPDSAPFYTVSKVDGKYVIPDLSSDAVKATEGYDEFIKAVHAANGYYVYPDIDWDLQNVIRKDLVMINGVATDWELGIGEEWKVPVYTQFVTGLWKDSKEATDGYKQYVGFRLVETATVYDAEAIKIAKVTDGANNPNVVKRYYEPIAYALDYQLEGGSIDYDTDEDGVSDHPRHYVYGTETQIPSPTRTGYTFLGWEVTVKLGGKDVTYTYDKVAQDFISADGTITDRKQPTQYASENERITLRAVWSANKYDITYDLSEVTLEADKAYNKTLPETYTYGSMENGQTYFSIPAPKRSGYTFEGWMMTVKDGNGEDQTLDYSKAMQPALYNESGAFSLMTAPSNPSAIILTPLWREITYSVVLDGNDDATISTVIMGSTQIARQVFDHTFTMGGSVVIPICEGYKFKGYASKPDGSGKLYIDSHGVAVEGITWTEFETNADGNAVLFAQWEVCYYNVTMTFTPSDIPAGVARDQVSTEISHRLPDGNWSAFEPLTAQGQTLAFGTQFRIRIESPKGYKTVRLGETSNSILPIVPHANPYVGELTVASRDMKLRATILPQAQPISPDTLNVDYINETISGFEDGAYRLALEDLKLELSVSGGKIRVNGQSAQTSVEIPNAFFGQTVDLYRCGDSVKFADSDPTPMTFAARPEAPTTDHFTPDVSHEDRIHVQVDASVDLSLYEFAISNISDPMLLLRTVWQTEPKNLTKTGTLATDVVRPGTAYYLFVRVRATADTPHGESCVILCSPTAYAGYRAEVLAKLSNRLGEAGCGENVKRLVNATRVRVETAITEVEAGLEAGKIALASVSIWRDVEAILKDYRAQLPLAEEKDAAIAALSEFLTSAREGGCYTPKNVERIQTVYNVYVPRISAAARSSEVQALYAQADTEMKNIPVHVIYDETKTIKLESMLGLPYAGRLSISPYESVETLLGAIRAGIGSDRFTVPADMSVEEARAILSELDVIGYYGFALDFATVRIGDSLRITLTIPEELLGSTGLRVLYFDPESGDARLLPTETSEDGTRVTFIADSVGSFALLADATVELGGIIIALVILLLAQLTVLGFLLFDFIKKKCKETTRAAFALPLGSLVIKFAPNGALIAVWVMALLALLLQAAIILLLLRGRVAFIPREKKVYADEEDDEADDEPEDEPEDDEQPEKASILDTYEGYPDDEEFDDEDFDDEEFDDEDFEDEDFEDGIDDAAGDGISYVDEVEADEDAPIDEVVPAEDNLPNERIFISEDGEVFYGESEETAGMKEFDPAEPSDEDVDEDVDEDSYKYDE